MLLRGRGSLTSDSLLLFRQSAAAWRGNGWSLATLSNAQNTDLFVKCNYFIEVNSLYGHTEYATNVL